MYSDLTLQDPWRGLVLGGLLSLPLWTLLLGIGIGVTVA